MRGFEMEDERTMVEQHARREYETAIANNGVKSAEGGVKSPAEEEEWSYTNPSYASDALSSLSEFRKTGTFCDVSILAGEKEFLVHKCVLSAASPYFRGFERILDLNRGSTRYIVLTNGSVENEVMFTCNFTESKLDAIPLNGIDPTTVELLIDYAYTAQVTITKLNVQNLLAASNLLEMMIVREACCVYLRKHMDVTNCLGIQAYAEAHACVQLCSTAKSFALENFEDILLRDEFVHISVNHLIDLLSSDNIVVEKEEVIFFAALNWHDEDPLFRSALFPTILSHIRLPLLSPYFLYDVVFNCSVVQNSKECMSLFEEAKLYHLLPDRRLQISSDRTRPRRNAGMSDVFVSVGGEDYESITYVDLWNPLTHTWRTLSRLPKGIRHGLVVNGNNKIFVVGGILEDDMDSKYVWRYDPLLNTWQTMEPMKIPRSQLGLAVLDGCIYAVGGLIDGRISTSVECYDINTNIWTIIAPLYIALKSPSVVATDGCLYVFGGVGNAELILKFDTKKDSAGWVDVARRDTTKSGSTYCYLNGYVYAIGGQNLNIFTNEIERYNIQDNVWSSVKPMIKKRFRPGVSVLNSRIYVFGGDDSWSRQNGTIEYYDIIKDNWTIIGKTSTLSYWYPVVCLSLCLDRIKENNSVQVKTLRRYPYF